MIIQSNIQIHNIRKERNRLSDNKGIVLFRSAQNLLYSMKAKMLKGEIHDTLDAAYDIDATAACDNIVDDVNNSVDC